MTYTHEQKVDMLVKMLSLPDGAKRLEELLTKHFNESDVPTVVGFVQKVALLIQGKYQH